MAERKSKEFNHRFFYEGAYKITASSETEAVKIYRRNKREKYDLADTVSNTSNNYQAAVKRMHRMHAREVSAASVSNKITNIAQQQQIDLPDSTPIPSIEKKKSSKDLQKSIRQELMDFAQATFDVTSNIEGITRRYLMRTTTKKIIGTVKIIPVITLYVVLPYKNCSLVQVSAFEGIGCFDVAYNAAIEDAQTLVPVDIVLMTHTSKGTKSSVGGQKHTVYIGQKESTEHLLQALSAHTKRFFDKHLPVLGK